MSQSHDSQQAYRRHEQTERSRSVFDRLGHNGEQNRPREDVRGRLNVPR